MVIFRPTELPELVGLADRILVMYRQRLVGEVRGADTDDRQLLDMINTGEVPAQAGIGNSASVGTSQRGDVPEVGHHETGTKEG